MQRWIELGLSDKNEPDTRLETVPKTPGHLGAIMDNHYAELAELSGGFIHEIKNHLSTLGLNLQLLAEDFADPQTQRERRALNRIQKIQGQCEQLVGVANEFLRYARIKDLELTPHHLRDIVGEMVDFFIPTAQNAGIEIKTFLPASLPPVMVEEDLFKQAILNMLLNAEQAMPEGGEITIQAAVENGNANGDEEEPLSGDTPRQIALQIIDTGKGMDQAVMSKIFKPFYSTKKTGSGLGLATTRKIIEAHGGSIDVESSVGHGTKFTLRLPVQIPSAVAT